MTIFLLCKTKISIAGIEKVDAETGLLFLILLILCVLQK